MNDPDGKGKVRRAVTAVAGATVSQVLGNELAPGGPTPSAPPPEAQPAPMAAAETAAEHHEYVPEVETSTVTRGEDGSVSAKTGTVWHPQAGDGAPAADLPTVEEFEQIDVAEDAFGNFVIDATERFVVHDHGHDEVYVDHQHVVVPGDGRPGDTDLEVVQDGDVVVHENPDGTISVDHHGSLTYETHPDAPGHGDVEVFQEETVVLDEAGTGPPGVGVRTDEQAGAEDPFGEPAGPAIHQTETVTDKARGGTVSSTVSVPAPGPVAPPVVSFAQPPSNVDATSLAASATFAEHPVARHVEPKPAFTAEPPPKHSFATEPPPVHHDTGEVSGPPPAKHPAEEPHHVPDPPVEHEPRPPEHEDHPLEDDHHAFEDPPPDPEPAGPDHSFPHDHGGG